MKKMIKVIQIRSSIGVSKKHKAVLFGLGLRHIGHIVYRKDTKSVRGMIKIIFYMVKIEEC
ncbi:50S ribosomal protein L30 [Candidatus Westeberhardia cardiocondylae]|uniref:Large ribosomal subunit protein uL30 n=1 Tax=Candidatus Westeberhardia cardiocondylae TaxID=1594731 RepID=A0A0H5BWH4_9ENTR|nr:50S ribosomal protein L30 [Candidatus Westeberhardia cardiocondylae]CEN32057.1 50S ribosomal protein L30 [Candidatus Westeberhardia cardiocondylae]